MLEIMEDRKTSVLRVLTELGSDPKSTSDGDPPRSLKDTDESHSLEELKTVQQSKPVQQKKNQLNPIFAKHPYRCASMYMPRASSSRPKMKDVSQRIVSAKLLQIKELRNQLTLTQHELDEVTNENRFLKTLQKRQEVALRKYEGHEARLPQMIQSHNEEVRILTSKLKQLKQTNQRLVEKLKTAEHQLGSLQEQHCHLVELSRDQRLGEREVLELRVRELQHTVREQSHTIQLLSRKVDLERKNYKHELGIEKNKRNEVERKLNLAMQSIENLKDQIEAKEKCLSAMVPSRYVRTSQAPTHTLSTTRFNAHSQIPLTPRNKVNLHMSKHDVEQTTQRRSSTDHTGYESDMPDYENNTSDSTRTLNETTFPKIKPQMNAKNLRTKYKFSSKKLLKKEKSTETPEYSSSFASEEVSVKDTIKNSHVESERIDQRKEQGVLNSQKASGISKGRKYSVDSGVMNKSESGKMTQRTEQSEDSNSKTRRNSMSMCPTAMSSSEEMQQFLEQDSLAAKIEAHKSIRDELRELEETLLKGSSFLEKQKKTVPLSTEAEQSTKEGIKQLKESPKNVSDAESLSESREKLDDLTWNEIHDKIKAESDAAEAKLEEYYNTLEKSELSLEDTENYIALEAEQKERLLQALKEIDNEAQGVNSSSSAEGGSLPSPRQAPRRRSESTRYSSKTVDNLHKGKPAYDKVKIPVVEKMKKEEQEYLSDVENERKNKKDLMKELFGNFDSTGLKTDPFPTLGRKGKLQLNRSLN